MRFGGILCYGTAYVSQDEESSMGRGVAGGVWGRWTLCCRVVEAEPRTACDSMDNMHLQKLMK